MDNKQLEIWVKSVIDSGISADVWAKASGYERGNFLNNFLAKRKKGIDAGLKHDRVTALQSGLAKILGKQKAPPPEPPKEKSFGEEAREFEIAVLALGRALNSGAKSRVNVERLSRDLTEELGQSETASKAAKKGAA